MDKKREGIPNNRLFVIEPNPAENKIKPNEDLNIIVELETSSKSRSALIAKSSGQGQILNSQKDGSKIIKFIGGTKTNVDSLIGKEGKVVKTMDPFKMGQVNVKGQIWSAKPENDETITEDTIVEVVEIAGVKLIVRVVK
jgi:hypothetical protein